MDKRHAVCRLPKKTRCIYSRHPNPENIYLQRHQVLVHLLDRNVYRPATRLRLELELVIVIAELQTCPLRFGSRKVQLLG
jgi:hypothetical protein